MENFLKMAREVDLTVSRLIGQAAEIDRRLTYLRNGIHLLREQKAPDLNLLASYHRAYHDYTARWCEINEQLHQLADAARRIVPAPRKEAVTK